MARRPRPNRALLGSTFVGAAVVPGLALALVVGFLVVGVRSGPLDWGRLLTSPLWDAPRGRFGAVAMVWGTAAVAMLALGVAAPVGWAVAVAVNEIAPRRWRRLLRSGTELLAVVPSIVFGLIGVAYVRPLIARIFGVPGGDSLLAAGAVLAVMVLPTIVSVSVDALADVPSSVREAAWSCGLTRIEVVRSAVLPLAGRGMRAGLLLGLARALGETVAVFLVVGRADGRAPRSLGGVVDLLVRPGQTLTTKLNGPESVLAGTSGAHWAALCGLGLLLLGAVAVLTALGQHQHRRPAGGRGATRGADRWRGANPARRLLDRLACAGLTVVLVVPFLTMAAIALVVVSRGGQALHPAFWWSASKGASGGGVFGQLAGTALMVAGAGLLAAPVGLGLGVVMSDYAGPIAGRRLRALTITLGGVPSIIFGLWGYWLFSVQLGWGKSWLAGSVVLALVAVPPIVIAVAAAAALPPGRREAAVALGLRRDQLVRSVVVPHVVPGLVTGALLGLARAAGETAPLLFTATVFNGAPVFPGGVRQSPVASLPTHIFVLAQDAADPEALRSAWGAALVLIALAGLLVAAAVPARRWAQRSSG